MEDEVTRVESVKYLRGVSGHGVFSTLFLCLAAVLILTGRWNVASVAVIIAYGLALNGLSIHLWDVIRERIRAGSADMTRRSDRTLRAHSISPEVKAELAAGFVLVGGFIGIAAVVMIGFEYVGLGWHTAIVSAGCALGAGNFAALCWFYRT